MSKKDFKQGMDALLGESNKVEEKPEVVKEISEVKKEKDVLTTLLVKPTALNKMRFIAYWERKKIKQVVMESFNEYIAKYESTHGVIKTPPNQDE